MISQKLKSDSFRFQFISISLMLVLICVGCSKYNESTPIVKLHVPQNFMEYTPNEVWLVFSAGERVDSLRMNLDQKHGVFTLPTREIVQEITVRADSIGVTFSIVLSDGNVNRDTQRQIPIDHFVNLQPVFHFNEPYAPTYKQGVSFKVNMSNQEVLGFFDPNRGDRVHVHGKYHNWPTQGKPLEADESGIYRLETEIGYFDGDNLSYYYSIVSGENSYLPNGGRELVYRIPTNDTQRVDWFSDHKRIVRFSIGTRNIEFSDRTYIGVWIDGRIAQSDELVQVEGDLLETAFAIPEGLDNIQWAVIDAQQNPLTDLHQIDIDDNGVWIQM